MIYNYYELRVGRERNSQRALADQVYASGGPGVLGVFAPLLGYASNEALVLTDERATSDAVLRGTGAASAEWSRMSPTLRPHQNARPETGGIYVHNWFTIDGAAFDEFVQLSGAAWPDFEAKFDARIYGLFAVEPTAAERNAGARRLLLMTRYADLGEWQKSRDPTTEAMQIFARRRELTRVSLARACLLLPPNV
ncbi:hypothetical protein [Phenylobacterium soli]|uniref:NIPSNAP domain-containing protein n=1 Tax=Phenylobacterium soli TaxID=2170551 RepID=A0A328AKL4_9CAUL|nr:hypothetical protein [Phenylobacterium soli]RAK55011.1 hypothetical protein DJ017_10975 [Phenylobacterium soli]